RCTRCRRRLAIASAPRRCSRPGMRRSTSTRSRTSAWTPWSTAALIWPPRRKCCAATAACGSTTRPSSSPGGAEPAAGCTNENAATVARPRRCSSNWYRSVQALLHLVEFIEQRLGRARAVQPEIGADLGHFLLPGIGLHRQQLIERIGSDVQALGVEVGGVGQMSDGGILRLRPTGHTVQCPGDGTQVVAEARPQELAVLPLPEPVDVEDLRRIAEPGADIQPVLEVVAEVVAAERLHGHRVATHDTHRAGGGSGGFGRNARAD